MAKQISASVGRMAVNHHPDVVTVQHLLNQVPVESGGPATPLEEDGRCGAKTTGAIHVFQLEHFGWAGADGRVDPGHRTLAKLNEFDQDVAPPIPIPIPIPTPPLPPPAEGRHFVIHRMDSQTSFRPEEEELFFHVTDMDNARIAIYWLRTDGREMTDKEPPSHFATPSRAFVTSVGHAVEKLQCRVVYSSHQQSGTVSSRMILFLTPPVQIEDMPHHLIGPDGQVGPGSGDVSTAITGQFELVKVVS